MPRNTYAEHLAQVTPPQVQALQFTGADKDTGLFRFDFPLLLQGVWGISVGGQTMDWSVEVGLPNPADPAAARRFFPIRTATGLSLIDGKVNMTLPRGTHIRFVTDSQAAANLEARLTYHILQERI